ncbi:MAG: AAA family ATPase [Candidatus Doudnabacteria bacterium]|nr:AAA family ATPase [Candidatus Doudnabacteria bacterium]
MILERLAIINYKSCKNVIVDLQPDIPNVFIGINDAGKSVFLKAICLLLETDSTFHIAKEGQLTSDISNTGISELDYNSIFEKLNLPIFNFTENTTTIIGEFKIEEKDISEDFVESSTNILKWSIESLTENKLYILKQFTKENSSGKYFVCLKETKSNPLQLWSQNQTFLKDKKGELDISNDEVVNENKKGRFKNIELIRAIYSKSDVELSWAEHKDFVKKDKGFFPVCRYIDWNVTLKDVEKLAADSMASKIEGYKNTLQTSAKELSETVTQEVNQELAGKAGNLFEELPNITAIKAAVSFNIEENVSDIMINKTSSDGDIRLESQGEGVKKQIWFAFIKWASLQKITTEDIRKKFLWCFDEPEIHLYPAAQRDLYNILKKLSQSYYQVFVSTHSTIFVDRLNIKNIKRFTLKDGYSEILECSNVEDVLNSLKVKSSDFLFYDKFLCVEGPTEEILIPYFYELYFGRTLMQDSIQLINLGGKDECKKNKTMFEELLKNFQKSEEHVYYLLDSDSALSAKNITLIGTYDLEDSIDDSVWIEVLKECCGLNYDESVFREIRKDLKNDREHKFYKLLSDKVYLDSNKEKKACLPSKGEKSGKLIKSVIKDKQNIPSVITTLFQSL